ncbi:MAG TPA: two-component regulator propeller domain-containing protein [Verrucomicrobiae bacterium]|nr:two-component regulator propeller domain-containing protein [Verrucomicrobiae bacterium]
MKSKAVIVLFWVVAAWRAVGAESGLPVRDFAVRTWSRAQGLPDDSVTAILQTRDGFLWVGTTTKLVRFDGVKFTEFPLPLADTNAPARIASLCEDAAGKLWIGTQQDGLFCLDEAGVVAYGKDSGLVDDNVTSLSADAQGRVWIGTRAGLSRWDGRSFSSFTARDGLEDTSVIGVHVARSGVVWITTRSGMYQFKDNPPAQGPDATGRITPFQFETDSQGRRPEYLGAYEDRRGNLWAYGDTYLINLSVKLRHNHLRGVDATRIWSLCEGRDGRLWIGTGGRELVCFDDNNFQTVTVNELDRANEVRAICEDREGNLWLGTSGGGLIELLPQPVQVLRAEQGLPPGAATCLASDASGRIFAGFEAGGLYAGDAGRFERFAPTSTDDAQNLIAAVVVATDETLWIATRGNGLFGVRGGRKVHFTTINGLSHNSIPALCTTTDGAVWAGTGAGKLHRIKPSGIATRAAGGDSAGTVIPPGEQREIISYGKEHGLPGTPVTALLASRDGTIWLGTEDGQVWRQSHPFQTDEETARFVLVHRITATSGQSVTALYEDPGGHVWIGTAAAGLACWTGLRGAVVGAPGEAAQRCPSWSVQNGLPDDSIYGVLVDADGDLWVACGRGVFRSPRDSVQSALVKGEPLRCKMMFVPPSAEFQFPSPEFGGVRALQAHDGRLWFATSDGLVRVDRSGPDLSRLISPPVYLENIHVNGRPWEADALRRVTIDAMRNVTTPDTQHPSLSRLAILSPGARGRAGRLAAVSTDVNAPAIRFPTDVQSVEFEFTAPSFVAPERLNFRYKLEGQDQDWVEAGTERRARYGRLGYGNYRFRVAVSEGTSDPQSDLQSPDSRLVSPVWNEAEEVFAFTVPTPLWRAPVALGFYVLTAAGMVAGLARLVSTRRLRTHLARLEQQRVVERERMRIAQDMHDDIGSKLTKISFLSERAKMELGKEEPANEGNGETATAADAPTRRLAGSPPAVAAQIESIATTSRELLQTLDEIVWAVNPRNDSLEHLAAYLSHYAAEYFQNTEVQCEMRLPRDLPHVPLSAELRHNLFLAFEEVLNNALKHSGATKVSVEMALTGEVEGDANQGDEGHVTSDRKGGFMPRGTRHLSPFGQTGFQIKVSDNGRGFDVAAALAERPPSAARRGGNGLLNMRQRLSVVGGECVVRSTKEGDGGKSHGARETQDVSPAPRHRSPFRTTVILRIPLGNSAKNKL